MRIVYCIPSCYNSGGMERVLSVKANYLAEKEKYDVFIITTGQKNNSPYYHLSKKIKLIDLSINYDEIENLPIYKKIIPNCIKRYKHKRLLKKVLFQLNSDIVISMFTHELPFLHKIKDGSLKILEIHFSKDFRTLHNRYNHASCIKWIFCHYLNYRDCYLAKKYDKFVVLTHEDKLAWKGFSNIEIINNPLSFDSYELADYTSRALIAVGRLCPQKGFDMLINIWSFIDPNLRKLWTLSIYGSGPDYDHLNQKIIDMGMEQEIKIYSPNSLVELDL